MFVSKIVNLDEEWDSKLFKFDNWNIFQTSTWIINYQKIYFPHAKAEGLHFLENGLLIGVLPIISAKKYLLKITGSPLRHSLTPFMGFAYKEGKFEACYNALLDFLRATKTNILTITQGELFPIDVTKFTGSQQKTNFTSVLSLIQTKDELWKNLESKTRNQIRKGEKNNFTISSSLSSEILKEYLGLRAEMYQKQGMEYELSNRFLFNLLTSLSKESYRLLSITFEEKLISAGIFLLFDKICYYWDGVSRAEFNKLCPNNIIQWTIVKWAKSNGFLWYDLGGTNTPSIAHFKKGYGGISKEYNSVQIFHPKILSKLWNYKIGETKKNNPRFNKDSIEK